MLVSLEEKTLAEARLNKMAERIIGDVMMGVYREIPDRRAVWQSLSNEIGAHLAEMSGREARDVKPGLLGTLFHAKARKETPRELVRRLSHANAKKTDFEEICSILGVRPAYHGTLTFKDRGPLSAASMAGSR